VLQAIRRLLTRPECFRLERELPAWVFTRESSAPCQGTHNNSVERAMRPVCLSRKNSLFAGSDEGGENWACLASLIETCKLNSVNPQVYFTDLITRLVNGWPQNRIDELMPWLWANQRPP
jgi:hypothetical protein